MKIMLRRFNQNDIGQYDFWVSQKYVQRWYNPTEKWSKRYVVMNKYESIGYCQCSKIYKRNYIKDTYIIDFFIGNLEYLKMGVGSEIASLISKEIFSFPEARKIIAISDLSNIAAHKSLISAGYIYNELEEIYTKDNDFVVLEYDYFL